MSVVPRALVRTLLFGALCAGAILAAGRVSERIVLGPTDADMRTRAATSVRITIDALARELQDAAGGVSDAGALLAASGGDIDATRRLFDVIAAAVDADASGRLSVTVYDASGRPVAWGGRPSDLEPDRLSAGGWFVFRSTLGVRLVHVMPLAAPGSRTAGVIAAEQEIATVDAAGTRLRTRYAPVSIELPGSAPRGQMPGQAFEIVSPSGGALLTARVTDEDLEGSRTRWRRASQSLALIALSIVALLAAGSLLEWRRTMRGPSAAVAAGCAVAGAVIAARLLVHAAAVADWWSAPIVSGATYASALLGPLLGSPLDFLLTACAAGALVALVIGGVGIARRAMRRRRRPVDGAPRAVAFVVVHLAAGCAVAGVLAAHVALLRDTIASTTLDVLHFSLHPWNTVTFAPRIALEAGLVVWHATALGAAVAILLAASLPWRVPHRAPLLRAVAIASWLVPGLLWRSVTPVPGVWAELAAMGAAVWTGLTAMRLTLRYRNGSQAFRLLVMTLGLVGPAIAFYPTLFQLAREAKAQLVETRFAPQARDQRQTIQTLLRQSLGEIDRIEGLAALTTLDAVAAGGQVFTDRAFAVWQSTSLASYPATSSVELYGPDGRLVSRFAFNLPDDLTAAPRSEERSCTWDVYEEVAPFFAEERRVLHAGRAVCDADGSAFGSIVVHAILDYENLPFIATQSPYVELLRPQADALGAEDLSGRDVEYAVYGWSRIPFYASSGQAWPLDDDVFARVQESRTSAWVRLGRGAVAFETFVFSDRFGIYALGFPVVSPLDHLVNLAELTVLAAGVYLLLLAASVAFGAFSREGVGARALLREIRASFYRKLFLAFVAATVVPVAALALATSNYVADEMRANVEQEAVRTASAARRVVEDLVAPRAAAQAVEVDDNLMVWVSRLIDQDVNIFSGPRLVATSERNLFASGLLPTRTPAAVQRDIGLLRAAAVVTRERAGSFEYLLSATLMTVPQMDAVLTVPLTSRQRAIEAQIDTLNRRVLLGAVLFVICGAGLGYWLAERIADPVNRLTRATRRLARGDLDARVTATSSDELRRLVHDFNRMATELQRQRGALERTHRLEAWAEMARQVAHEIKNPLTPIQLNAEHLRRVHADRGEPMTPVLQECVATILAQVALLRRIASEFSSFASSPTVRPAAFDVGGLLREVVEPYRTGAGTRIRFDVDVPADLPFVHADRTLVARALINLLENALHAMPETGVLTVRAARQGGVVSVLVSDTGAGMDARALARAFEPYFSTKASGTGLGLPITKRNIELNGGSIGVASEPGRGTAVTVTLPVVEASTPT